MVTIASQLAEPFNDAVRALLPDVRVVGIPRGVPAELPDETSILIAAPIIIRVHGHRNMPPPAGRSG